MGSEWDYINEHMGGHDENGLPNFMNQRRFSIEPDEYLEEYEDDSTEEVEMENDMAMDIKRVKSYSVLENLIARIEIEKLSLSHITNIELESLKYAVSELKTKKDLSLDIDLDDYEDDIPF